MHKFSPGTIPNPYQWKNPIKINIFFGKKSHVYMCLALKRLMDSNWLYALGRQYGSFVSIQIDIQLSLVSISFESYNSMRLIWGKKNLYFCMHVHVYPIFGYTVRLLSLSKWFEIKSFTLHTIILVFKIETPYNIYLFNILMHEISIFSSPFTHPLYSVASWIPWYGMYSFIISK